MDDLNLDVNSETRDMMRKSEDEDKDSCSGNEGNNEYEEDDEEKPLNLDTLPVEVLLHITTFIPAWTLINCLLPVSRYFHKVLTDENTWRIRHNKMHRNTYPPIPFYVPKPNKKEDNIDQTNEEQACSTYFVVPELPPNFFRLSALKRERILSTFSSSSPDPLRELSISHHIACVDAIHLFNDGKYLASGSRDRSLVVTNLDKAFDEDAESSVIVKKPDAHGGWIWDVKYLSNVEGQDGKIATCGWDCCTKVWDLNASGNTIKESFSIRNQGGPHLCLSTSTVSSSLLALGTFNREIHLIDTRSSKIVNTYKPHTKSVLSIGFENNLLVSGGEDGRLCLIDIRQSGNSGLVKKIQLPNRTFSKSMSYGQTANYPFGIFYAGDMQGSLHLVSMESFSIVRTYEKVHDRAIQGVFATIGSLLTCSSDGQLIVHQPSLELETVRAIQVGQRLEELPKVHALNNRIALAGGTGDIRIFQY